VTLDVHAVYTGYIIIDQPNDYAGRPRISQ